MFLADFLDNRLLMKQCKKVTPNQYQDFGLTTKMFMYYSRSGLNHLFDFDLKINDHQISIDSSLFSCLCDKFQEINHQEDKLTVSVPNEYLNCFLSFFDIMKGYSLSSNNFGFSNLKCLIDCFGITSLFQFIHETIPIPQTLESSLQFISQSCCEFLNDHFNSSLSIIIQNFNSISFETLCQISNSHLIKIFSSDSLQIESEDYLFQMIVKMIEEDKNRIQIL
jgi:hypothetical protein